MLTEKIGHDVRVAHDGLTALQKVAQFRPSVALLVFSVEAHAQTTDEVAITALGTAWEKAFNDRDPRAMAQLYTFDCIRMPEGAPATIGRPELAAAYRAEFEPLWEREEARIKIEVISTVVTGSEAYARGESRMNLASLDSPLLGTWFAVYRKQVNGRWLYHWSAFAN